MQIIRDQVSNISEIPQQTLEKPLITEIPPIAQITGNTINSLLNPTDFIKNFNIGSIKDAEIFIGECKRIIYNGFDGTDIRLLIKNVQNFVNRNLGKDYLRIGLIYFAIGFDIGSYGALSNVINRGAHNDKGIANYYAGLGFLKSPLTVKRGIDHLSNAMRLGSIDSKILSEKLVGFIENNPNIKAPLLRAISPDSELMQIMLETNLGDFIRQSILTVK